MKKGISNLLTTALIILAIASSVAAQVATGSNYALGQSSSTSGGGVSNGATGNNNFSLTGTIGQAVAGTTSANSPFTVSGGFFAASPLSPTAASVTISGRVRMANGKGIRNVIVTLTEADGTTRTTLSGVSGQYRFTDIAVGQMVIVNATAKRFTFSQPTQVLNLLEEAGNVDFIAQQQQFSTTAGL